MEIICRKTCCKYNNNFACMAGGINVEETAICHTFEESDKKEIDSSKKLYKKPVNYNNKYRYGSKLCIGCKAKCQFNHQGECQANGITVNDLKEKPYCITFFPKLKK